MNTIKLTPRNVRDFIGCKVILVLGKKYIVKQLLDVHNSGNFIHIEYPELQNRLNIVLHTTYVLV
jgi:hypothetical protein